MLTKKGNIDLVLLITVVVMTLFGAAMVYSASAMLSLRDTDGATQFSYLFRQLIFIVVGLIAMFGLSQIDYKIFNNPWVVGILLLLTTALLIAVLTFDPIKGAQRWIRFGSVSLQPSEGAKLALAIILAFWLHRNSKDVESLFRGLLPCAIVLGIFAGLILYSRDLGTTLVIFAIFMSVTFAAGMRKLHLASLLGVMALVGGLAVYLSPFRFERLMAFSDPEQYASTSGYQVLQSLEAIGSGGVMGEGFGDGHIKLSYLPLPYSDFIFSVVGEEFGLLGTLSVVAAFVIILWRGSKIAVEAPDRFGFLLSIGIVSSIVVQALFNISVVTSLLPAKGIPLPFISFGGTSVVVSLMCIGILLNISKQGVPRKNEKPSRRSPRRGRR